MKVLQIAVGIAVALSSTGAYAHGDKTAGTAPSGKAAAAEEKPFGRPGERRKVSRTIRISMLDTMRFDPARLRITKGETVKFVVHNAGRVQHEMVLGTLSELKEHAELMRKFPEMEHEEANLLHVEPGKSGELVWRFNRAGEFYYGCLVPGHFEAGMVGRISVKAN